MDPFEKPSNPNVPGPPVSSSQGDFQFGTGPFGLKSFGQNVTNPQNNQFGSWSTVSVQIPPKEFVFNNPFASPRSITSIFGGHTTEVHSDSVASQSQLFGGPSAEQRAIKTSSVVTQSTTATTFSNISKERAIGKKHDEEHVAKHERKRQISAHPGLPMLVKNRIRSILSENRTEEDDDELKHLQEVRESLLKKLGSHNLVKNKEEEVKHQGEMKAPSKTVPLKLEKKHRSAESNEASKSPGKVTKEDKALFFTLPNETFTKTMIKEHFSVFGDVSRVYLNTSKNHCIIHFARHEDAIKAYEKGSLINGCSVKLFWRNVLKSKKKSETVKEVNSGLKKRLLVDDPEVQEELAAMGGLEKYRPLHQSSTKSSEAVRVLKRTTRKEISKSSKKEGLHRPEVSNKEPEPQFEKSNDGGSMDVFIEASAGAQELIAILKTSAATLEDRLRILEARDKLIRLGQVKQCDLAHAKKTVGVCPDMCPEKERLLRETRRQVSFYEMDESSKPSRMNPSLAVKQYARSSADQEEPLPHELRPLPIMTMTMGYLLHCIADLCDRPGENLAEWYHFLWDRTRSIRKEITQQELCDLESVVLVEQCARFHIHCCARLVAEDVSVFDHRINTENLTKCLQTLKHMYYDLWSKHNLKCPNEPEFMTYFLMLNLTNGSVMWELEQLREDVLQTREIDFAAKLYMAINSNNFVRFFRLVRSASYLVSCLAIRYFYQVRTSALRTHIKALNARTKPILYPLATLVRELAFEDLSQGEQFCAHHGLSVDHSHSDMPQVLFSRNTFRIATTVFAASRFYELVESKRNSSVGQVIAGGALPPRTFENHVPHDSFDSNGCLKQSAWQAVDQGMMPSDLSFEEDVGISEMDSSATPSELDESIKVTESSPDDPQPIITEPPEEKSQPTPFQSMPAPQISNKSTLTDIIAPLVRKPIVETTSQPPKSVETTSTFSFSTSSQTRSIFGTSTSVSQQNTTSFKSIFGASPKSATNSFMTSSAATPIQSTVTLSQDVKPSSDKTPLFSKNAPTGITRTVINPSALGEATSTSAFGGATTTTPSLGAVTTSTIFGGAIATPGFGVASTSIGFGAVTATPSATARTPTFGGVTTTHIFGGGAAPPIFGGVTANSSSADVERAQPEIKIVSGPFGRTAIKDSSSGATVTSKPNSVFGGVTSNTMIATPTVSSAFSFAGGKSDAKTLLPGAQIPNISEVKEQNKRDAEAAAAKKKADAQEAEEKMRRARVLENHVIRLAGEAFDKFVADELRQLAEESLKDAKESAKREKELREKLSVELGETLMTEVLLEQLEELAAEELNLAIEEREKAIRRLTAKYFRRWLEKTRLSLSRKKAIESFPAGLTHLSLEEHAKRWGQPSFSHIQDFVKQDSFRVRGIPKLAHTWTSLSSLVGKEVMLRYHDRCRQLRWKHSSEVSFKVVISVSKDSNDRSTRIIEWFVRNPQQLKHGSAFENSKQGVIRYVTTYQLALDQIVHSSLQLVRGNAAVQKTPELVAGTNAILFSMNLSENTVSCCDRLEAVLDSLADLPAPPLVVIVFGNENSIDSANLKTLVFNLDLHKKLRIGSISDYKVLYLKEAVDMQTADCELKKVLCYTAQRWLPPQQFTVKPMRTVLMGAFDMFFISLKCSMDRDQPSVKSINDPQILTELCNEFLKFICAVLLRSRRESTMLCAPELWPNIHKGAYGRFHDHPQYERHVAKLLSLMRIPAVKGWPPNDPKELKTWLLRSESIVSHSDELIDRWSKVSPWPQVLEDIPWIEVFKTCMEKKFEETNMSELGGTDLYVIVGSKRLEKLHNDPWWKHCRRLHMYLSKFEKQVDDSMLVDDDKCKLSNESDPPLKRRCIDEKLLNRSVPAVDEICQLIEEHQQSLRDQSETNSMDQSDLSEPKTMSRLESYIDSLQSRLGIGPYSSAKVEAEPVKLDTPKRMVPVPVESPQPDKDLETSKEDAAACQQKEKSREVDENRNKMKSILEAARKIVAPLDLPSVTSKRRKVVRDFLLGREKGDLSAVKIPLSALSKSNFVERSRREVEKRINLYKRRMSPERQESYDESSQSDSASRDKRKRSSSDRSRSSLSVESPSSVEAYSVTSDEEETDNNRDNRGRVSDEYEGDSPGYDCESIPSPEYDESVASPEYDDEPESPEYDDEPGGSLEYDNYDESVEGGAIEVIRSSRDGREDDIGEEEGDDDEEEENGDGDFDEDVHRGRELSESDIKITDDDETFNVASEGHDDDIDGEMEEDNYEEGKYGEEDDCSDVQEISSDEEIAEDRFDKSEPKRRSDYLEGSESSSDEIVSDYE